MGAWITHFWYVCAALVLALLMGIFTLLVQELNKMSAEEMEILVRQPPMTDEEARLVVNQFESQGEPF